MKITYLFFLVAMLVPVLSAGADGDFSGEEREFRIDRQWPSWYNHYEGSRMPRLLFEFTGPVDLEAARRKIAFVDARERRVAARVELAEEGDFPEGVEPVRSPSDPEEGTCLWPRDNAIVVTPAAPLPVGDDWEMRLGKGIPGTIGGAVTGAGLELEMGDVEDLSIRSAAAIAQYDVPRRVDLEFNKALAKSLSGEDLEGWIAMNPEPEGFAIVPVGERVRVEGRFESGASYRVSVAGGLPAADGTLLARAETRVVKFVPQPPYLSLPAESATRRLSGLADFEFVTANLKAVRVRAKRVEGSSLLYAMRAYELYSESSRSEDGREVAVVPYDAVAGRTVFSEEFSLGGAIDESGKVAIAWERLLGEPGAGAIFIDVEGVPRDDINAKGRLVAQSLVQVTDLGLVMKLGREEGLVFAFSQESGAPLGAIDLSIYDREKVLLTSLRTDETGVARVAVPKEAHWIVAETGMDRLAAEFGRGQEGLSLWRYGISVDASDPGEVKRRTMIFTDRPVYEPGETVHVKAMSRVIDGEGMRFPVDGVAQLSVWGPQDRLVLDREVSFSATGSLNEEFRLPGNTVGWYRMMLNFEDSAEGTSSFWEENVHHYVRVDEYRPNSFEVSLSPGAETEESGAAPFVLEAKYLMGKALSKARYSWTASLAPGYFYSEAHPEFEFGSDGSGDGESPERGHRYHGEGALSEEGTAELLLSTAAGENWTGSKRLDLRAEVVDINQQTIGRSASLTLEGSDFYLGMRRLPAVKRPGEEVAVEVIALCPDGANYEGKAAVRCLIEKQEWSAVRMDTAGGGSVTRNASSWVAVQEAAMEIEGGESKMASGFAPEAPGRYRVSVFAEDERGRPVETRTQFYVQGEGEGSFVRRDGTQIDLETDKERYVPGETAMVAVKSPIAGTALITVERNRVRREIVREIAEGGNLIEIPIEEGAGPNVFLSALVVRGSRDCPRKIKEPDFKIGYREIQVDEVKDRLAVRVEPSEGSYRPGETVALSGKVTGDGEKAVARAEVTLYAVDEGVLRLMGYETPAPYEMFHAPMPLAVRSSITLTGLLRENSKDLTFGNKGRLVGGGGEMDGAPASDRAREDFRAMAFWNGAIETDGAGMFRAEFTAPDSLTRYRVMAVVCEGVARFGNAESSFEVKKPLMIEPALARFGNAGDRIQAKGVVHNLSERGGRFEVGLTIDGTSAFDDAQGASKHRAQSIVLKAGETGAVSFPVRYETPGAAEWTWEVAFAEAKEGEEELRDRRTSRFEVGHPLPLMQQSHYARLERGESRVNALDAVDAELLGGEGFVTVSLSRSRILEAADALEYILKYPYGCVEQTTSSLLPWLRLTQLRDLVPILDKPQEEVRSVVQLGADRLLSMQTPSGGLGYWPGAREPMLWGSAYGGLGLALAVARGAEVSEENLGHVYDYLAKELRSCSEEKDEARLIDLCLGAYTLAVAGRPEHSYHEVLFQRRKSLSREARCLLAMAVAEARGSEAMARKLLEEDGAAAGKWQSWLGPAHRNALELMAWSALAPRGPEAQARATELLSLREGAGHWGSTHINAWATLALGRLAEAEAGASGEIACEVVWGDVLKVVSPEEGRGEASVVLPLSDANRELPLRITGSGEAPVVVNVKVQSRPESIPMESVEHGYRIERTYREVLQNGELVPAEDLEIGDVVLVQLTVSSKEPARYLVIDDPLPCLFEAINPHFESQAPAQEGQRRWGRWAYDHQETRTDRVLFFRNWLPEGGESQLEYLARVIGEGEVIAPAAKIEEMYLPQRCGLSEARFFEVPARPGVKENVAVRE